ncbi:hypothetical protein MBLNU230_g7136t1 [Neophaeotheca triangularis]
MPLKGSRKRAAETETYESDNGFIEDAPKSKKSKQSAGNAVKDKDGKTKISTEMQKDDDGSVYWEVSKTRRIQISDFKGQTMVGIREFYEKDGKSLPGKKGISLPVDQFAAMLDVLPEIESVLKSKGVEIPRPKYDGVAAPVEEASGEADREKEEVVDENEEREEEAKKEEEVDVDEKPAAGRLDKFRMKKNHEATSDEDEG